MNRKMLVMAGAATLLPMGLALVADEHVYEHMHASGGRGASREVRQLVKFPAPLLQRELAHLRAHLGILGQPQAALSRDA